MPEDYLNNLDTYGNYIRRNRNPNKAAAPTVKEIPIKAWVYRNDDGSGNISLLEVEQIIDRLNLLFSNSTNFRFYLLCDITEINNSDPANDGDEYFDNMCFYNNVSGTINVHFVINSNSNWSGKAHFPDDSTPGLRYTCAVEEITDNVNPNIPVMASVLAHEIGHTLGLYHTHSSGRSWSHSNNGGCGDCHQESVSRTKRQETGCISTYNELKCDVNGDFLCDTAADPELTSLVNSNCDYNTLGGGTDNWNTVWTPNTNNVMSYSTPLCRDYFSPLQVGKMNYYYTQIGINYPSYSINGNSYVCNGQTASYSISSLPGVTNYTWESSTNLPIISGQGSNSITVQASNSFGGYIKVSPDCGYSTKNKTIGDLSSLQISGFDNACPNYSYNYTIPSLSASSYSWSITNGNINYGQGTTSVNITLSPNPSNQTWLTLAVTGLCSYTIYKHKIITHGDPPAPAPQCISYKGVSSTVDAFTIYPNPASSQVTIVLPTTEGTSLNVMDLNGKIIYTANEIITNKITLNLENYQSGVYFISVKNERNTLIKRLIIKNK